MVSRVFREVREIEQPPLGFPGSWPEYVAYRELGNQGYKHGEDFDFQTSALGGRQMLGGLVADFLMFRPPGIVININGRYWHYDRPSAQRGRDIYARVQFTSLGYRVVFVDDDDLLADPGYYVEQALQGIDHSELSL